VPERKKKVGKERLKTEIITPEKKDSSMHGNFRVYRGYPGRRLLSPMVFVLLYF